MMVALAVTKHNGMVSDCTFDQTLINLPRSMRAALI
jgi:hypothetical protein